MPGASLPSLSPYSYITEAARGAPHITVCTTVQTDWHLFCSCVLLCDSNTVGRSTCVSIGPYCEHDLPSPSLSIEYKVWVFIDLSIFIIIS